jgi:hypothetical protein
MLSRPVGVGGTSSQRRGLWHLWYWAEGLCGFMAANPRRYGRRSATPPISMACRRKPRHDVLMRLYAILRAIRPPVSADPPRPPSAGPPGWANGFLALLVLLPSLAFALNAPTGLTASKNSDGSVTLAWVPQSGAGFVFAGYNMWMAGSCGALPSGANLSQSFPPTADGSVLSSAATASYTVKAPLANACFEVDFWGCTASACSESGPSNQASTPPPPPPSAAPLNFTFTLSGCPLPPTLGTSSSGYTVSAACQNIGVNVAQ